MADVRRLPVPITTIWDKPYGVWGGMTVADRAAVAEGVPRQLHGSGDPTRFEIDVEILRGCRRPQAHPEPC